MKFSGEQFEQLHSALLSAFPDISSLAKMVRIGLEQNLEKIAGGADLDAKVFSLINWAEAGGQLKTLVEKARLAVPGNQELKEFDDKFLSPAEAELPSRGNSASGGAANEPGIPPPPGWRAAGTTRAAGSWPWPCLCA